MTTQQLVEAIRAVQAEIGCAARHPHPQRRRAGGGEHARGRRAWACEQVQACVNGYGERCGNANMLSIIANLKLKLGIDVVTDEQLAILTEVSHYVSEIANMVPNPYQPYVGASAFTHKAGLHVAAVLKNDVSVPARAAGVVGNAAAHAGLGAGRQQRRCIEKLKELGIEFELSRDEARALQEQVNELEAQGYQYEGAEASFELLVRRARPGYAPPFELDDFWIVERRAAGGRRRTTARCRPRRW